MTKLHTIGILILLGAAFLLLLALYFNYKASRNQGLLQFTEIGREYDDAYNPIEVNGKLAFIARRDGKAFVVDAGEKRLAEYEAITEIANIGSGLAFTAVKDRKSDVFFGNQKILTDQYSVSNLHEIEGQLTFNVRHEKSDNAYTIYFGGEEVGKEYDFIIGEPVQINGKLAFLAQKQNEVFLVSNGEKASNAYKNADTLISVNATYAFIATKPPTQPVQFTGNTTEIARLLQGKSIVVYDGKELGEEYDGITHLFNFAEKLLYIAATKTGQYVLVLEGKEITREYDQIFAITDVNGRLAFAAKLGVKTLIFYDNEKIDELTGTETLQVLQNAHGKLAYAVKKPDGFHVQLDGKKIGVYEYIRPLDENNWRFHEVLGKLAFAARIGNKWALIYDGKELTSYDDIDELRVVGGKLTFTAGEKMDGGIKRFIVMEK